MARPKDNDVKFSIDDLKTIVAAGMSTTEARLLLEEGYQPEDVLELAEAQAAQRQNASSSALVDAAKAAAEHAEKARNPFNRFHPEISAFSYPEGDRKKPKPIPATVNKEGKVVPFEMLYNGYPCHKFLETEHWRECELFVALGAVAPGDYTVIRKDNSTMTVTITKEFAADGSPSKVDLRFPVSREDKPLIPAKAVVMYQIVHAGEKPLKALFLAAMHEWLSITLGEPVEA